MVGEVMKKRLIVLSDSKDPYINQTIEEILFTSYGDFEQILFLWVNAPSVVFGRNQNPWREIDVKYAEAHGIQLVRRLSGGGTVYHDTGNLNFSFIENHSVYDEKKHFHLINEAIGKFGLTLDISPRKDMSIHGEKVSGSAFYLKGMRRLHHGTLLVDSDLEILWNCLKVKDESYKNRFTETRSIASVGSPVVNLSQFVNHLKVSDVINAIVDVFYANSAYEVQTISIHEVIRAHQSQFLKLKSRHNSWDWIFGETPDFNYCDEQGNVFEISGSTVKPYGNINSIF